MSLANCNKHLIAHGKPNPRTCAECQLGPCKYPDGFIKIHPEEAAGLSAAGTAGEPEVIEVPAREFPGPLIKSCSVRVMRSFDYCHFEIVLGGECGTDGMITFGEVDALRKHAARLADKAVEQYKVFKKDEEERQNAGMYQRMTDIEELEKIREKNESDRSVQDMARLKAYDDRQYRLNQDRYDYQDDWED